jgi:glucosyl-3-phosphoglycerate synthase
VADIYQSNLIATFHRLGSPRLEDLEAELVRLSRRYRLALVLPALYSEFEGDALPGILDQLPRASYVDDIVMVLGRAGSTGTL